MQIIPRFITPEGLINLKNHKYNGGEYTYLDKKMNIFWYKLIDYIPTFLAPNTITLIGACGLFLSFIVLILTG